MSQEHRYIEERDGSYYLRGHRIPLITIMHVWFEGSSPESIRDSFPSLTLNEIYAGILYYLENKEMLDQHFKDYRAEEARISAEMEANLSPWKIELRRRIAALQSKDAAS